MASVDIRNVKKSYGIHPVIHGVSVSIKHGEFVILVGPSGCGKSTLLRMIAGLEPITEGDIAIGGNVVTAADAVFSLTRVVKLDKTPAFLIGQLG